MTMNNDRAFQRGAALLWVATAVFLLISFGRFLPLGSTDLAAHYLLVDEIMRYGGVRPHAPNLGIMATYPPAAHWLAAIAGWIGGSGLIGMVLVCIVSVFCAYVLIGHLLGATSPTRMALFLVVFALSIPSRSLIGWEVQTSFFFPQLVADVIYLAALMWLAKDIEPWKQIALILLIGTLTMWVQPVVAVHVFAAGLTFIAFQTLHRWVISKKAPVPGLYILVVAVVLSVTAIWLNPVFQSIRANANHDGALEFGYSRVLWIAAACGGVGTASLVNRLRGRGELVDSVLGCACVAAVILVMLQFVALKLHGEGSIYAVKKHMFFAFTLAAMNAVRLIAGYMPYSKIRLPAARLAIPIIAGAASWAALSRFDTPVAPVVRAINYANDAAQVRLPHLSPGNTVVRDGTAPRIVNWMISLSAFEYPFNLPAALWLVGEKYDDGARFAMVRRSPAIDKNCSRRYAESEAYVVVESDCLSIYSPGDLIRFGINGEGIDGSPYKTTGWGRIESMITWASESAGLSMTLPAGIKGPFMLTVEAGALLTSHHPKQVVDVLVNNQKVATWTYALGNDALVTKSAEIAARVIDGDTMQITFKAIDAVTPVQADPGSVDTRVLGLAVKTLRITPS